MIHTPKAQTSFACCFACNLHGTYFMSQCTEISLNPALSSLSPQSLVLRSLALVLSLQSSVPTFLSLHVTALTGTSPTGQNPGSKKTALPNILAAILGPRPESTGTVPSFFKLLAVGGKSWHLSSVPPLFLHLTVLHARTQSGQ